jgi:threonylcarbamoyladenosine tRNA methylthiotransferase MtaB
LLRDLGKRKRLAFVRQFLGETRPVLVESRRDEASGMKCGFSDNYLPVLIRADSPLDNQIVTARLERLRGAKVVAVPV